MSLTINEVANMIIESAEQFQITPVEDVKSVDSKSHRLIFALSYHGTLYDPKSLAMSLIADLMGIDFYTEENALRLIQILKTLIALKEFNRNG